MPIDFGSMIAGLLGLRPDANGAITGGQFTPSTAAQTAQPDPNANNGNQSQFTQGLRQIVPGFNPGGGQTTATAANTIGAPDPFGNESFVSSGPGATDYKPAQPAGYQPLAMSPAMQRYDALFNGGQMTNDMMRANVAGGQMVGQNVLGKDTSTAQQLLNLATQRNLMPGSSASLEPQYQTTALKQEGAAQGTADAQQAEALYRQKMAQGQIPLAQQVGSSGANANIWDNVARGTISQNTAQTEKALQPTRLSNLMQGQKVTGEQLQNQLKLIPDQFVLQEAIARLGRQHAPAIAAATGFPGYANTFNPLSGAPNVPPAISYRYGNIEQQNADKARGTVEGRMQGVQQLMNPNAGPTTAQPAQASPRQPVGYAPNGMPIYAPQQ